MTPDQLSAFESTLPATLPADYRPLLDGSLQGYRSIHLRFRDHVVDFYDLERMARLRTEGLPHTITVDDQSVPVLPFAQDQDGPLLLELAPVARVWRWRDGAAEPVADTLARFARETIAAIERDHHAYVEAFWRARQARQQRGTPPLEPSAEDDSAHSK